MKCVLRIGSPNIDDYLLVSNLYAQKKQEREVVRILERARITNPYFRELYENLGAEYMQLGQYGDTVAVLRKGIELFPGDFKLRALEKKPSSATLAEPE